MLHYAVVFLVIARTMPVPLLTVAELTNNPSRWHGRKVMVRGWLTTCLGEDCAITSWPLLEWEQHKRDFPPLIAIAETDSAFDLAARKLPYREVVITVRFRADCYRPGAVCLDRYGGATPIPGEPIRLVR